MIFPRNQNWRTSSLPFSLALANTVNTGVGFDTPSGAVAETKRWATRGMQGFGPQTQYCGAGLDGLGHGCGCGGSCGCGSHGMGELNFDGTGLLGTGLFGQSAWGFGEWTVIGLGAYALWSAFMQTKRGVGSVKQCIATCRGK